MGVTVPVDVYVCCLGHRVSIKRLTTTSMSTENSYSKGLRRGTVGVQGADGMGRFGTFMKSSAHKAAGKAAELARNQGLSTKPSANDVGDLRDFQVSQAEIAAHLAAINEVQSPTSTVKTPNTAESPSVVPQDIDFAPTSPGKRPMQGSSYRDDLHSGGAVADESHFEGKEEGDVGTVVPQGLDMYSPLDLLPTVSTAEANLESEDTDDFEGKLSRLRPMRSSADMYDSSQAACVHANNTRQ